MNKTDERSYPGIEPYYMIFSISNIILGLCTMVFKEGK